MNRQQLIEQYQKDFYVYQATFLALAGASSANGTIQIEANSDFVVQKLSFAADIAAAVQTDSTRVLPLVTIQLTDTGSGRQYMNEQVPITALFGNGQLPFILPNPRFMAANSVLQIAVTNLTAATTYNLYLSFIGFKYYG